MASPKSVNVSLEFTDPYKKDNPVLNVFKNVTDELAFSAAATAIYSDGTTGAVPDANISLSFGDGTPEWVKSASDLGARVVRANPPEDAADGTYDFELKATASFGGKTGTATQNLKVNVERGTNAVPARLYTGTEYTNLPKATMERYYSANIAAYGTQPIKWEIVKGELPAGLRLNPDTGEISGTPEKTGESTFYVKVTNACTGQIVADGVWQQEYTLSVVDELPGNWDDKIDGEYVQRDEGRRKTQVKVKKNRPFDLKMWTLSGTNAYYTVRKKPNDTSTTTIYNSPHRGAGYVNFNIRYRDTDQTYWASVRVDNSAGRNEKDKKFSITKRDNYGEITDKSILAAGVASEPGAGAVPAEDETEGGVTGVTYSHDGSVDEEGNITAIIEGTSAGEYVYGSLDAMLAALTDEELARVIRLEFRKGASLPSTLNGGSLSRLTGLLELTIDDWESLHDLIAQKSREGWK